MTRLLASVRDAAEARAALAGGADLIDVKEPLRGSLGAADRETIAAVVREVARRAPVSAALGELAERHAGRSLQVAGLAYAKLGLAGCVGLPDWQERWSKVVADFPAEIAPVAVVYADWRGAAAPAPSDVLAAAASLGCRALLIDTFDKALGGLYDHWPPESLGAFVAQVREAGLLVVLAGSLSWDTIPTALAAAPDYIALRGALCRDGRTGHIDLELVQRARHMLRAIPKRGLAPSRG